MEEGLSSSSSPGDPRCSPRKKRGRALSPATKDNQTNIPSTTILPSDQNVVNVAEKRPDLVKTVRTIEELNDALQRYLLLHPLSETVLNFKGNETMEEIISALFILERQQGAGTLGDEEKEREYDKLMTDLKAAGYNRENTPPLLLRHTSPFESTEDLLSCLVGDSSTSPSPTSDSSEDSTSSHGLKIKDNVNINPSSTPEAVKAKSSLSLTELLERTGGDIMEVDRKTSFNDIQLEEPAIAMDLDEVEGSDLLLPTATGRRKKESLKKSEDKKEEDSDDDSFHSAHTTLSTSPAPLLPKSKDDDVRMSTSLDSVNERPNNVVDADMLDGKKQEEAEVLSKDNIPVQNVPGPVIDPSSAGLTEDELELMQRYGLTRCSIRINRLDEGKKEEESSSEEVSQVVASVAPMPAVVPRRRAASKGSSTSSTRRKSPRKTVPTWKKSQSIPVSSSAAKTKVPTEQEHLSLLSTSDKPSEEPIHKKNVVLGTQTQAESSTGKTRIKARKPTEEELLLAAASSLTPEQVILRKLTNFSDLGSSTVAKTPYRTMFGASRRFSNPCESQLLADDNRRVNSSHGKNPDPQAFNSSQKTNPAPDTEVTVNPHAPNSRRTSAAVLTEEYPIEGQGSNGTGTEQDSIVDNCSSYISKENALTATATVVTPTPPAPPTSALSVTAEERLAPENVAVPSSKPEKLSIEQELDDLLGVIPSFDDDDEPLSSSPLNFPIEIPELFVIGADGVDNYADIFSHEPGPLNSNETHESDKEEKQTASTSAATDNERLQNTEPTSPFSAKTDKASINNHSLPENGSSTKSKPDSLNSKKSKVRPGPKSKTRRSDESDVDPETSSPPSCPSKRRKISPSSSSSSSDAYVPLVTTKDSSSSSSSAQRSLPGPGQQKKIILVDVDEDDSHSSGSTSGRDSYSPLDEELEDMEDLFAIHPPKPSEKLSVIAMQEEWGLDKPRESRLKELMNKTSSYRRRFFEADNYDIDHGMKVFPALKSYKVLKAEYDELNPEVSGRMAKLEKELINSLNNATTVKKRPGQKRAALWERALLQAKNGKSLPKGVKRAIAMICLCFHLAENHAASNLLFVRKRGEELLWQSISTPRVVMFEDEVESENAKSMYVYAEGLRHVKVPNVYEGVLTVYSLHYVFSVEYLAPLRDLFKHFDTLANIKT